MKFYQILRRVVKYAALTVCGILLYLYAAKYALTQRGYFAVGGEVFLLLLPVYYYIVSTIVRDVIRDIKNRKKQ
ncbi:hypothetical protein [uncultured Dysosmobacter sp.]|uniref:hypothetical protein n=1 Tax=uncultured Dysosmobacter sp. TaxID=2591384 RepID=UPI002618F28E|nr:hypothetical protein [uncultured Dysosmobacter sp.]